MFVHKALSDALSTQKFKTSATELVKKAKDETLLAQEFQVSLFHRKHINAINSAISSQYCWAITENAERTATSVFFYQRFSSSLGSSQFRFTIKA